MRASDVAELQQYLLKQAARRRGVSSLSLTPAAVRQLQSYNYPNNIQVRHGKPDLHHHSISGAVLYKGHLRIIQPTDFQQCLCWLGPIDNLMGLVPDKRQQECSSTLQPAFTLRFDI